MRFKDKTEAREANNDRIVRPKGVSDEQWTRALDLYEAARKKGDKFPELTVAQAALETGWFKHMSGNYNYFGQKAGKSQRGTDKLTSEYENNRKFTAKERFRDYESLDESIDDRLKKWGSKYEGASNIDEAISKIWQYDPKTGKGRGYATDINYDNKIGRILNMMGVDSSKKSDRQPLEEKRTGMTSIQFKQLPTVAIDNTAVATPNRKLLQPLIINTVPNNTERETQATAEAKEKIRLEESKFAFVQKIMSASRVEFIEPVQSNPAPQFQEGGEVETDDIKDEEVKIVNEENLSEEEIARVYKFKNSRVKRELEFRTPNSTKLAQAGGSVVRESTAVRTPNFNKQLKQINTLLNPDDLETEEAKLRNKKPQTSLISDAFDFVDGNIKEFITNPIKEQVTSLLPETLQSDKSLQTSSSRFDNTEDIRPYLLDNKSISEIRKEKNISFAQISNDTGKNAIVPLNLKRRIVNSIYPQGYTPESESFIKRFNSEDSQKDEQIKRLKGVLGDNREDIFLMYSGLPQRHDTFTASSFKAGKESDTNLTFKDPDKVLSYLKTAAIRTDLFDKLANGEITPDIIRQEKSSGLKGAEKSNKASFRDPQNVMWNATFGVGYDKTGQPYLSFYDNWDLVGKDDYPVLKDTFGSPIEIYDRIPLTDELIKALAKTKKVAQSDSASDTFPAKAKVQGKAAAKKADAGENQQFDERFEGEEVKEELKKVLSKLKKRLQ